MSDLQELLIREEARFALWALRAAAAIAGGDEALREDLRRGFELADVTETATAFWRFADALCAGGAERIEWHHPQCSCLSAQEMAVLHCLAAVAARPDRPASLPDRWWQAVVPAARVPRVDRLAADWLRALRAAGVVFPGPGQMLASLDPLQNLVESHDGCRVQ